MNDRVYFLSAMIFVWVYLPLFLLYLLCNYNFLFVLIRIIYGSPFFMFAFLDYFIFTVKNSNSMKVATHIILKSIYNIQKNFLNMEIHFKLWINNIITKYFRNSLWLVNKYKFHLYCFYCKVIKTKTSSHTFQNFCLYASIVSNRGKRIDRQLKVK